MDWTFPLLIVASCSALLNLVQIVWFIKQRDIWITNIQKAQEEFERIKTVANRIRSNKPDSELSRPQPYRPKDYKPKAFEKALLDAKLEFCSGPDAYSITILRRLTAWDEGGVYGPVAHYWPKSQWWNLIGLSEKGHGLNKMLEILNNGH